MPQPRSEQLNLDTTLHYHCVSRCVRRAFLCGRDERTGRNYDYRKEWIEDRLIELSSIYAVEIFAYAVMSNHFHIVVRIDPERASKWSESEVVKRYRRLFRFSPSSLDTLPASKRKERIATWRERLSSLSWMMRSLNENIARRANREDECTGRFWEGRFRCQPLLDEAALLACMAYVDLNPIRAGASNRLAGRFTSVGKRLKTPSDVPQGLVPALDQVSPRSQRTTMPVGLEEYRELLEWTRDRVRGKKSRAPAILTHAGINADAWSDAMRFSGLRWVTVLGSENALEELAEARGRAWIRGKSQARRLIRK